MENIAKTVSFPDGAYSLHSNISEGFEHETARTLDLLIVMFLVRRGDRSEAVPGERSSVIDFRAVRLQSQSSILR